MENEPQYEIEMAIVSGGTFMMGAPEQERDLPGADNPAHEVTLSDFYIGKYPVTQGQWKAVMGDNPSRFEGDDLPVEQVSWNDIHEFITKLNDRTGMNYRLPTEAEWEYAARGGNQSSGFKYSGSDDIGEVAWYCDNSEEKTHSVGTKKANELDIYDMSGNVCEWVNDWYGHYSGGMQTNPQGDEGGSSRVTRGGCWNFNANRGRVSDRDSHVPGYRHGILGFRLARGIQSEPPLGGA